MKKLKLKTGWKDILIKRMESKGWGMKQVASRSRLNYYTVRFVLNQHGYMPRPTTLAKICKALGLEIEEDLTG